MPTSEELKKLLRENVEIKTDDNKILSDPEKKKEEEERRRRRKEWNQTYYELKNEVLMAQK